MPVHDWTKVDAGLFHAFHHRWIDALCDALNGGALPADFFALPEQRMNGPIPDALTLRVPPAKRKPDAAGGAATVTAAPRSRVVARKENAVYSGRAARVTVRHRHGDVVAVIEPVSPGNKATAAECRSFVTKSAYPLARGVHLLVVDLFPPGKHDPHRLHQLIWDEFASDGDEPEPDLPAELPLTLASYDAGPVKVAMWNRSRSGTRCRTCRCSCCRRYTSRCPSARPTKRRGTCSRARSETCSTPHPKPRDSAVSLRR